MDRSHNTDISTSGENSMQTSIAAVDTRYGVASANPASFRFPDLSSNAHGESSHFELPEESGWADATLPNLDSQHRPGPDPIQSVSTLSSSQNERPVQNSEMNIKRKRLRSAESTNAKRLTDAQRQLAKRTRVPEASLSVMCFNPESQPKRSRTSSQKQNKKDVENVGGSCLLCFVDKKKVFFQTIYVFLKPLLICLLVLRSTALRKLSKLPKLLAETCPQFNNFHVDL